MEIKNSFNVPLPPPEAWRLLMDIPRIAPCMPGAELIERLDDRTYKGKVSVKLGPVALAFVGTAQFEMMDESAQHARVRAQGSDSKGRGGAAATVDFQLAPSAEGTCVEVTTDMALTGSVAQYGRATGIIQSVSTQLLNQFATNLRRSLTDQGAADPGAATTGDPKTRAATEGAIPISAFGLITRVIWDAVKRLLGRRVAH
jgi:carbon monoxide dehydrogenase subunit G